MTEVTPTPKPAKRKRRHQAAATRLLLLGVAAGGTANMAVLMAADAARADVAVPVAAVPPVEAPTATLVQPAPPKKTVIIIRRHLTQHAPTPAPGPAAAPPQRAAPAKPAPAKPAPAKPEPVTESKGS